MLKIQYSTNCSTTEVELSFSNLDGFKDFAELELVLVLDSGQAQAQQSSGERQVDARYEAIVVFPLLF